MRPTVTFHELPGGEIVLYSEWDEVRDAAMRHLGEADVAIVTSYCPDAIAASEAARWTSALPVFYDLDAPVTLARLKAGEDVPYLGERGLRDFDLVLSYTGGHSLHRVEDRAWRAAGGAALRKRGSLGASACALQRKLSRGFILSWDLRRGPPGGAGASYSSSLPGNGQISDLSWAARNIRRRSRGHRTSISFAIFLRRNTRRSTARPGSRSTSPERPWPPPAIVPRDACSRPRPAGRR